jgi:hypothetical protein
MATNIGSLAPGLAGYAIRIGIRAKGLRKPWGNPHCTHFTKADCLPSSLPLHCSLHQVSHSKSCTYLQSLLLPYIA